MIKTLSSPRDIECMGSRWPGSRRLGVRKVGLQALQLLHQMFSLSEDSALGGRLPDFLGLGVQKGGTTMLQKLLEQHPGAYLPSAKELHYFSLRFSEGEAWYREQFSQAVTDQLCGEITPYYVFHPEAPARVHELLPDARLIVLLRDPVERSLSQYFHSRRLGLESLPLEQALAAERGRLLGSREMLRAPDGQHRSHQENSYLSRSRYEQQLPAWQALYPSNQLLVLRSEDLFEQPTVAWERVLRFLDLSLVPMPELSTHANAGLGEAAMVNSELRSVLRKELQPTYSWAAESFGMEWR